MIQLLNFLKTNKLAFAVSIAYVGSGTLAVCSMYPNDVLYGGWSELVFFITFPVSILSFGYRFAESSNLVTVFFIQFLMLVLTFLLLSKFFQKYGI